MKKLVLLLAVVFGASLFSCNNAAKTEATEVDSAAVVEEVVEVVTDSVVADTTATDSVKA